MRDGRVYVTDLAADYKGYEPFPVMEGAGGDGVTLLSALLFVRYRNRSKEGGAGGGAPKPAAIFHVHFHSTA